MDQLINMEDTVSTSFHDLGYIYIVTQNYKTLINQGSQRSMRYGTETSCYKNWGIYFRLKTVLLYVFLLD